MTESEFDIMLRVATEAQKAIVSEIMEAIRSRQQKQVYDLMVTYKQPNEIVRRLQAGEELISVGYEDGSYWFELGDYHFDHDDDPALGRDIELAERAGLIQEVRNATHRNSIVLTELGKTYGKDWA